jgi:23S rRNA (guanosine2251-2'-O)-methyltransferase
VVPGQRAVIELLRADPGRARTVLVREGRRCADLEAVASAAGVEVRRCTAEKLESVVPDSLARGVVALADPPPLLDLEDLIDRTLAGSGRRLLVALDGVEDPRNLGAIMRSCAFFAARGLFWAKDRAATLSPAAVKASAGASEHLALGMVTNLARALDTCKKRDLWVLGTVADDGEPLDSLTAGDRLPDALVVVLGGEHQGLRPLTRKHCDFLATIERRGQVTSLNVSAATAVVLAALA